MLLLLINTSLILHMNLKQILTNEFNSKTAETGLKLLTSCLQPVSCSTQSVSHYKYTN